MTRSCSIRHTRQVDDMVLFLGPATLLLFLFFVAPVIVDLMVASTDMGPTLKITKSPPRTSSGW